MTDPRWAETMALLESMVEEMGTGLTNIRVSYELYAAGYGREIGTNGGRATVSVSRSNHIVERTIHFAATPKPEEASRG